MILKEFVPPILNRWLKTALKLADNKEYKNYSQAIKTCTSDAYLNVELCNMIADKTVIHARKLNEKPYILNPTNVFLLAAINQYIINFSKKDLTILDFGGACGFHYFEIKRFMPKDIFLKWYVVETEQMVKSAIERGLSNAELNFVSSIDDVKTVIDFIHSSCALHYVPNPYELTNMLINRKASRIFFNRMMFNENDRDFVTVQKSFLSSNGPGKLPKGYIDRIQSYPHTTLSFQKFNSLIINSDYEIEWIFEELSGSYHIKNERIVGKGLLYALKPS
jgi:putative methyltransferase (TIGR04325 family)